jgi:hypothetical protein
MDFENLKNHENTLIFSVLSFIIGILAFVIRRFWKNFKEFVFKVLDKIEQLDIHIIMKSKDK